MMVPNGSMWFSGLSETRPRERAVLSPSAQAAAACALSWMTMPTMTATALASRFMRWLLDMALP